LHSRLIVGLILEYIFIEPQRRREHREVLTND
jgi:hypothetical protein